MKMFYIRTSTVEQHTSRQEEMARQQGDIEKVYVEQVSGKNTKDRPVLQEMLSFARQGDVIYIADFSRLARSVSDLLNIVSQLESKGISLISIKENFNSSNNSPTGKLMLTMMGAISEFELSVLHERQRDGIVEARKRGVYKGRKPVQIKDFCTHYTRLQRKEISKSQLAQELGIARQTLYNLIAQHEITREAIKA